MLHTDMLWEEIQGTALLREFTGRPGLRQYFCVEIPINLQLIHLDISTDFGDGPKWSRYIFDDIRKVLPLLKENKRGRLRLSLQTRRLDQDDYKILRIREVVRGEIIPGWEHYAFICSNNLKYYESVADLNIGNFKNEKVEWSDLS